MPLIFDFFFYGLVIADFMGFYRKYLDGNRLARRFMNGFLNFSKAAFTNNLF